jgi:hypothetical protein
MVLKSSKPHSDNFEA